MRQWTLDPRRTLIEREQRSTVNLRAGIGIWISLIAIDACVLALVMIGAIKL